MDVNQEALKAVDKYKLEGNAKMVRQLEATHKAFQVQIQDRLYALRQFNPYMHAEDLCTQFRLARLLHRFGLQTPVPIPADGGRAFVEVKSQFWTLFPWCNGQPGQNDSFEDLCALTSMQGTWIACCERARLTPQWNEIVQKAQTFRQRKSWAWIVPLDQLPRFFTQHRIVQKAQSEAPAGPHRESFLNLLPEVESSVLRFAELLRDQAVSQLPHTVTHGDFWASNICVSDEGSTVLDLDCYSFEPRVTDFARAANWYYQTRSASENASLFRHFQEKARLSVQEAEALPLMMCAHDLYYAIGHVLLFLHENPESQARLLARIQFEIRAPERYQQDRDRIRHMFMRDAW